MAKQKEGVYDQVLYFARQEFLEKGYQAASLRTIADRAGTSTSSIYTRFHDKAGLFDALVSPSAQGLLDWFQTAHQEFHELSPEVQSRTAYTCGKDKFVFFVDYVYDHFDDFYLVICCGEGTSYEDYIHRLIQIEMDYDARFAEVLQSDAISSGRLTRELMHMLDSAFYNGIFEMVRHRMTREQAHTYVAQIRRFFICGWRDIYEGGKNDD